MPENLTISENISKKEKYLELIPQIKSLIEDEPNFYANLANIAASLHSTFKIRSVFTVKTYYSKLKWWWIGFYLVDKKKNTELVLGPFQGPIACTRIKFGKGVCGSTWKKKETIIVEDVDKFPGHIACSSLSKSEIVVPIFHPRDESNVIGVLDADSELIGHYDETDKEYLIQICSLISEKYSDLAY